MRTFTVSDGNTTIDYSKLMYGTSYLGYDDPAFAYEQLDRYVALGGRTIDTARVYSLFQPGDTRPAERAIGEWLQKTGLRDQLQISTKGGHPDILNMSVSRLSKKDLTEDLTTSLTELKTDVVDIYWVHRDDEALAVGPIMETLHSFVKQGLVRQLGASNWTAKRIKEANDYANAQGLTPFAATQLQWSYAVATPTDMGDETLVCMNPEEHQAYQQMGLPVFAYEAQAKGFFSKLATLPEAELPPKVLARFLNERNRHINLPKREVVASLCKKYNVSEAVIALCYITCNPLSSGALIGCSKLSQLEDSMAAADLVLSEADFKLFQQI